MVLLLEKASKRKHAFIEACGSEVQSFCRMSRLKEMYQARAFIYDPPRNTHICMHACKAGVGVFVLAAEQRVLAKCPLACLNEQQQ